MSFKVHDGTATIDLGTDSNKLFFGTTAEGIFPPVGVTYEDFAFTPCKGVAGTVIFKGKFFGADAYTFYQFDWKGNKLILHYDTEHAGAYPGKAEKLGYYTQIGTVIYLTGEPVDDTANTYKKVDLIDLLKFLEGKIDLKELEKRSFRLRLAKKRRESMQTIVRLLQTRNRELGTQVSNYLNEIQFRDEEARRHDAAFRDLGIKFVETSTVKLAYARIINSIPKWITCLCVWKYGLNADAQHLKQLYNSDIC